MPASTAVLQSQYSVWCVYEYWV